MNLVLPNEEPRKLEKSTKPKFLSCQVIFNQLKIQLDILNRANDEILDTNINEVEVPT